MIIDYRTIPHSEQRYETCGDWWFESQPNDDGGDYEGKPGRDYDEGEGGHRLILHIRISRMSDPRYELLVFHHELTEALLCREKGVTAEMVDEWDKRYEQMRELIPKAIEKSGNDPALPWAGINDCGCEITETSEPGDDLHAPYYPMHQVATQCEKQMAKALEVDWAAYNEEVEAL